MQVELRTHAIELSPEHRAAIVKRAVFAFDRFADRIMKVTVSVTDTNGPRGGAANECVVSVDLRGPGGIIVKELSESALVGSMRAVDRAGKSLARALARKTDRASLRTARVAAA
jgi:ribosome-associated translation inhibitor RaiA